MLALLLSTTIAAPTITARDCEGQHGACCRVYTVTDDRPTPAFRCEDSYRIDMLWVVTEQAVAHMGGTQAVLEEVQISMAKANEAFANTGFGFNVHLVGLHVTQYDFDWAYLYHVQNPNDGFMDEVPALRDAKAADIVSLITVDGYCGVAFVAPGSPDWGYQGNSADCLLMDWASPMRHELGHNLGSKHYSTDGGSYFSWSAGHVLTLDDGSQVGTCLAGNNLPNFSNPDVLYDGVPTGIPAGEPGEADNHLAFSVTVPMVARHRCSTMACYGDTNVDGMVNADDVLAVLAAWGPAAASPADVVVDGVCDVDDLLVVVSGWGECP